MAGMMKKLLLTICTILVIGHFYVSYAQGVRLVSGTYQYVQPRHMTMEQAEMTAIEKAKIQILADEFGTLVGAVTTTKISTVDGQSSSTTFEIGESEVRGEWLETIGTPEIILSSPDGKEIVYTVKLKGKAREISSNPIEYEVGIYRNVCDERNLSLEFRDGDSFFLSFESPIKGYLAIYLVAGDTAFRLLPYREMEDGAVQIKANRRYLFFSEKDNSLECPSTTMFSTVLLTSEPIEYNRVYTIFSPEFFSQALDDSENISEGRPLVSPNSLDYKDFQKWLFRLRQKDRRMMVRYFDVTIKNK